jgi:hypothetical protein
VRRYQLRLVIAPLSKAHAVERDRYDDVNGQGVMPEIAGHLACKGCCQAPYVLVFEQVNGLTGEVLEPEWRAEAVKNRLLARTVRTRLMSYGQAAPAAKRG